METTMEKVSVKRRWVLPDGVRLAPGDRAKLAWWRRHRYLHVLVIEGPPGSGKSRLANALCDFLGGGDPVFWDDRAVSFEEVVKGAAVSDTHVVVGDLGVVDRRYQFKGLLEYKHSGAVRYRRLGCEGEVVREFPVAVILTGTEIGVPANLEPWTLRVRCVGGMA
jgi:hypothetical protein